MKGLYLVIGESGSGKDTLVDTYCKETGSTKLLSLTDRENAVQMRIHIHL